MYTHPQHTHTHTHTHTTHTHTHGVPSTPATSGPHFTCFTGTKVQVLTRQKALWQEHLEV